MTMRHVWSVLALAACSAPAPKLQWIDAPPGGDIPPIVREELAKAAAAGNTLLVYIGADWCPPCVAFHEAVDAGKLDAKFPGLRLLAFDADRDGGELIAAGYDTDQIPTFAVPRMDGRSSGKHIKGAIIGRDVVEQLMPRLTTLLAP
jgi:thiol-disulfide isomerase/thioredoxin